MGKRKMDFHMPTDWIVKEPIDLELKEYLMLDYFQKINKSLEKKELYPVFTELSLHLANLQTLLKQNQVLDTRRKLISIDDEFTIYDLISKKIPDLSDSNYEKLRSIILPLLTEFKKQFELLKSFWNKVHDSIDIKLLNGNKKNLKFGFFFFTFDNKLYVYEFKNRRYKNILTTKLNLIHCQEKSDLTLIQIIKNYTTENKLENNCTIFEVKISKEYPLENTLVPLIKRKILSYLTQTKNLSDMI